MNALTKTISGLALVAAMPTLAGAATWTIDPVHSQALFKVTHLGISSVTGKFDDWSAEIAFDPDHIEKTAATATIQVTSVDTDNEKRDGHLRSDDFFNAEKFPQITFASTKVTDVDGKRFKLHGNLTIRDVTKPVVLDVEFLGAVTGMMGEKRAAFTATTTINRQDFNVRWNKTLELGGLVVSDDVDITLQIEAVAKDDSGS